MHDAFVIHDGHELDDGRTVPDIGSSEPFILAPRNQVMLPARKCNLIEDKVYNDECAYWYR